MMLVGMAVEAAEYSAVFESVCFYTLKLIACSKKKFYRRL
jgi:hypothetical protein